MCGTEAMYDLEEIKGSMSLMSRKVCSDETAVAIWSSVDEADSIGVVGG